MKDNIDFFNELFDNIINEFLAHGKKFHGVDEPIENDEYDRGFHKGYLEGIGYAVVRLAEQKRLNK